MPESPPTMGLSGAAQIWVLQAGCSVRKSSEVIFEYKTEPRRINLAYTARNRSTDSIRVLLMYDLPRPGHLYKAREGAVDGISKKP